MTSGRRILVGDGNDTFREMLSQQLLLHGECLPTEVSSGAQSLKLAKTDYFDVMILDVGLPDMDGRDVCRLMRRNGVTSPIIMLTGTDTDTDTILGLDAGANDYITKPFCIEVLLARLRAHIRQHERSGNAVFTIGPYTFQPTNKLLLRDDDGRKVRLTSKETAILRYLCMASDRDVCRNVLLTEVWGYSANVTSHTLESHVYRLRQKIESDPYNASILITELGGYRLVR